MSDLSKSGVKIRYELDTKPLEDLLTRLREGMKDLSPVTKRIASDLLASTRGRFDTGIGPDGNPWPKSLRVLTQGGKTLADKGHLRDSVSETHGPTWAEVGTNRFNARIHQFGGVIKAKTKSGLKFKLGDRWITKQSVKMPARPFIGISDDDVVDIRDALSEHLARLAGPAAEGGTP